MKITICGSSTFRREMLEYRDKLNQLGHEAIVHSVYEDLVAGRAPDLLERIEKEHAAVKKQYDFIKWYYKAIVDSDGVLVLNFDKNEIQNYIGGNTLMEMAFAHVHDKRVFLLNPVPEIGYKDEIVAMVDEVLDGDLSKIGPVKSMGDNPENNNSPKIILGTKSTYRREAFEFLGLDFVVDAADIDEYLEDRPDNPEELVKLLSRLKAEAVAKKHSEGIVIGFDSVGWFNGEIEEKPKSKQEAYNRLKTMSGKRHQFYTGIHMINIATGQTLSRIVTTNIFLRELSDSEIKNYLEQDQNLKTHALCYDPLQLYSASFVRRIEGSYNNLIRGIPLEVVVKMLFELGYNL